MNNENEYVVSFDGDFLCSGKNEEEAIKNAKEFLTNGGLTEKFIRWNAEKYQSEVSIYEVPNDEKIQHALLDDEEYTGDDWIEDVWYANQ